MTRILMTGATGLIGSALVAAVEAHGGTTVKLVRRPPRPGEPEVQWDPAHPANPVAVPGDMAPLEGCDMAVHLAGANLSEHRWTASYKETIRASRMDSSRALIEILSRLKTLPRVLVCASAIGIYGDRGDEVLTEASAPGTGFLPDICKAWETSLEGARALGVRVVHLRFGVVLAPAGGAMKRLLPVFKAGLGGRLGDGRQYMSWVTLGDAVRSIEFVLNHDTAAGALNVVAPNPVTNIEFTRELGHAVHRPAPWIVPSFALRALFGQMAEDTLLASTRVLPAGLEALGFTFQEPLLGSALSTMLR